MEKIEEHLSQCNSNDYQIIEPISWDKKHNKYKLKEQENNRLRMYSDSKGNDKSNEKNYNKSQNKK